MQQVALSWLVYRLTGLATLLGVVGFASQIPILLLGPIGGVINDRYSCHRVAVWTQCAALAQALLLALLTLTHMGLGPFQPALGFSRRNILAPLVRP
jgi:nitrate/nitrite transporter NarK